MKTISLILGVALGSLPATANTLVYCSEGSPDSFNPQTTLSGTARNAIATTIYERLVEFKPGSTDLIPGLAESWSVSPDKLTYSFKLRRGVNFHTTKYFTPGRELNADDVLFSFQRQHDPKHAFHGAGHGHYQYYDGMGMRDLISSIRKTGPHAIEIKLIRPNAPFLANLAMPFMSILSAEYADRMAAAGTKDSLDRLPVGTGPFAFKKYVKDSVIRYQRHDTYWRGAARIRNLAFAITPDPSIRYQKLKKGECQIAVYPAPEDLAAIRQNPRLELPETDGLNIGYLALNTEKKPFDNPLVRQAIAHALNKQRYVKTIYRGNAKPAINPFPPTMWGYNPDVATYAYDPAKARQLLKKAGLADGFKTTLWTLPVSRPFNPNGKKMGELMQQDLAQVGIKVELRSYDWATYLAKVKDGEHDIVQLGWSGDNGDPDNFLYTLLSCDSVTKGSNNSRYCQPKFDGLIRQARTLTAKPAREKAYREALAQLARDVPIIPIAHAKVYRAVAAEVANYRMDPFDLDHFHPLQLRSE